jgi:hypothetical protein
MSHHRVGIALNALLDDDDLRVRFAIDPIDALADLGIRSIFLTPDEIDVFIRIDPRVWSWTNDVVEGRTH